MLGKTKVNIDENKFIDLTEGTYLRAFLFLDDIREKLILLEQWLEWSKVWVGDLSYLRKV